MPSSFQVNPAYPKFKENLDRNSTTNILTGETSRDPARGGESMPAKKAKKKARPKKKARKAARKPTKRKVARKSTAARQMKAAGPQYSCILCGVEVAVTKSGLGISRLMCCGQPMSRK
jgi:desulfoferrodoxin-like iron-binding protein